MTADAATLFPDNFAALAEGLVRQLKSVLPPEQVQAAFGAIARDIAAEIDLQSIAELPLERRLDRVADFLNQRGYLARWEPLGEDAGARLDLDALDARGNVGKVVLEEAREKLGAAEQCGAGGR